jgi:DNA-binding transcriptional ArsR family regulator
MLDVEVIEEASAAAVALDPIRSRILAELAHPASAAGLAARLGLARQKVNYHLRELEKSGLVRVADKRKWGGLTERLLVATATTYIISPSAMGQVASDPCRCTDRLSASYLIALAARIVREVAALLRRSTETGKRLATLSMDMEIRFRSATERAAFTEHLTTVITQLAAQYHDESAPGGRSHRVVIISHPLPAEAGSKEKKS